MSKIQRILSSLLCIVLIVLLCVCANNTLAVKTSREKNGGIYNNKNEYEVLFLGSSHMIMGVSPMELWKDYGITSYNLSDYGQWIPVDYWTLVNALDYQKPKLVVLDVHAISIDEKYSSDRMAQVHDSFDCVPISRNKFDAISDLMEEDRRVEFLFPFSYYHSRWNELSKEDFEVKLSLDNGANIDAWDAMEYAQVSSYDLPVLLDKDDKYNVSSIGVIYLKKLIEVCQEKNIAIALVALPYVTSESDQRWLNGVEDIAAEYGVNYYNMNHDCSYINFATDMFDEGHLASSGARKTTKVLGQWILENYDLTSLDASGDSLRVEAWNKDYEAFAEDKLHWLKSQTMLESYLMLLNDDEYRSHIIASEEWIINDSSYIEFFDELARRDSIFDINQSITEFSGAQLAFEIIDSRTGETVDMAYWTLDRGIYREE